MTRNSISAGWRWAAGLALPLVLLPACESPTAGTTPQKPPDRRPSLLLVVVDALRPDHLGSYGYPRPTSPELDVLAKESVRFSRARSVASWTKPSIPSLFTSLYPSQHGVFEGNAHAKGDKLESDLLPQQAWTLAEALQSCGYRNGAFVHNAHLRADYGFGQGFERYDEMSTRAPEMAERLLQWIREVRAETDSPFFAYLHLLDVHWPYEPTAEAARLFDVDAATARDDGALRDAVNKGYLELTPPQIEQLVQRYDAEIRGVDTALGHLLSELARLGDDDLVLAVTSDHGEAFLEHDYLGHGRDLYEESLRIPLLLRLPGGTGAGRVVDEGVSLLDVMPTFLELARCSPPETRRLEGRSLLSLLDGKRNDDRDAGFAEVRHGTTYRQAIWKDGWKLIRTVRERATRPSTSSGTGTSSDPENLVGLRLEIEGIRLDGRLFLVDEIEVEQPGDRDDEISGTLEALDRDRRRARVAGFEVDFEDAVLLGETRQVIGLEALKNGAFVKVEGDVVDADHLVADKLSLRQGSSKQEIEGLVRRIHASNETTVEVEIAGLRVVLEREDLEQALGGDGKNRQEEDQGAPDEQVRLELYRVRTDLSESVDLSEREPAILRELLARLETTQAGFAHAALPASDRVTLDDDAIQKLRELGYIE